MNLTDWARQNGIHPQTAYRWFRIGTLPVAARRVGPRTVLIETDPASPVGVALYARVSSHDQRSDLDRQLGRLVAWAAEHQLAVTHTVAEVGSGMNGARPKLRRLLSDRTVRDMIEVLTSLCARLYGRRSARTRANRALRGAAQPVGGE